jgi:hypothetical protein
MPLGFGYFYLAGLFRSSRLISCPRGGLVFRDGARPIPDQGVELCSLSHLSSQQGLYDH